MSGWRSPVTVALLIANLAVFGLELVTGATRDMEMLDRLGPIVSTIFETGEYYRLFTAMFLHGGFLHLFLNMWALYQLGSMFEIMFGSGRFLLTYFGAGLVASIASTHHIPADVPGVGASGAIFGILGALIFSIRRSRVWKNRPWTRAVTQQLMLWAGLNIMIGLSVPGIDNAAHIGGFVAGLILGFLPHKVPPPPPGEQIIEATPIEREQ